MSAADKAYFPEIDGLRAIAVVAVVLFHANIPGFASGYLGVDIFFVISGFLITRLLVAEVERSGRIDYAGFYARRVRRLLPSLVLVMLFTLGAALLIFFPGELPRLGKSATSVVLMVSNLHFMKYAGGYFAPSVDVMPLLHTWSLSVEEQFYLFWPLLVLGVFHAARKLGLSFHRSLLLVFSAVFLASLAFWWLNFIPAHSLAFYAMPARVWQLALGALLAVILGGGAPRRWMVPGLASALGLPALLLMLAALSFAQRSDQAGLYLTLTVSLLTGLVIFLMAGQAGVGGYASRCLSWGPVIAIGRLSYAWYLWHWPLLALTRSYALGEKQGLRDAIVVLLSLFLSWLTWRYVETPVRLRRPGVFARSRSTLLAGLGMLLLVALAAEGVLHWGKHASRSFDRDVLGMREDVAKCNEPADGRSLASQADCTQGVEAAPISLLAWGDSHAGHLKPLLAQLAAENGRRFLMRTYGACPPLTDVAPVKNGRVQEACGLHNDQVRAELDALIGQGLTSVVLGGRWNAYLGLPETNPAAINSYALVRDWQHAGNDDLKVGVYPFDHRGSLESLGDGLRRTLSYLVERGVRVLLVAPVPEPYFNAPHCVHRRSAERCVYPRSKAEERRAPTLAQLQKAAEGLPNVRILDPIDNFCDRQWCYVQRDGLLMYGDTDHITAKMATSLHDAWSKDLGWVWQGK